jgi:hypothetical protein
MGLPRHVSEVDGTEHLYDFLVVLPLEREPGERSRYSDRLVLDDRGVGVRVPV